MLAQTCNLICISLSHDWPRPQLKLKQNLNAEYTYIWAYSSQMAAILRSFVFKNPARYALNLFDDEVPGRSYFSTSNPQTTSPPSPLQEK